jgi:hypothetical protein
MPVGEPAPKNEGIASAEKHRLAMTVSSRKKCASAVEILAMTDSFRKNNAVGLLAMIQTDTCLS